MLVREVMSDNVEIINPEISLREAARKMKNLDCGALPIGENDKLIGMITDRDITVRAVAEGKDPDSTHVRNVMTDKIKYIFEDRKVEEAGRLMEDEQIRRLVVINKDKRAVGICSLGDIATHSPENELSGNILENVSKPS